MRDAGRIGFDIKGEYDNAVTYEFLDVVYYDYSSYVAKKETSGNPPVENNEYWQILAKGQLFGVSGVKGDKETNYRAGDVNITAENVGALPITGGIIAGNSFYPLYVKNASGSGINSGVGFVLSNADGNLINIQGVQLNDEHCVLRIFDFKKSPFTCLLELSNNSKKIYNPKTNNLKEVLVEGDALPSTGGAVEGTTNPLIKLKRENGNFTGIQFENQYGHIFNIEGYRGESGTDKQLNIFANDWNLSLLRINDRTRVIYDYKTKTEKAILIDGDDIGNCTVNGKKLSEWLK